MADSADGMVEELDYEHENDGGEVVGEEVEGGDEVGVEGGGEERGVQGSEGNIEEVQEGDEEEVVEGGGDEHEFTKPADKVGRIEVK